MNDEDREIKMLRKLLNQRLSFSERLEIERRLRELEKGSEPVPSSPVSPFLLGVWDKPAASSDPPPQSEKIPAQPAPSGTEKEAASKETEQPPHPDIEPAEAETLAHKIADLADRISFLRSYWARTLSPEIDRDAEACLARLHDLARSVPLDLAETALGSHVSLLSQKVRELKRPRIAEKMQLQILPPSAPSLDNGAWAEVYYAFRNLSPPPPEHPPGYIGDGLQQFL